MKNARARLSRNGLVEEGSSGNQVNLTEDGLSPHDLGGRPQQRKHQASFEGTSEIDRVGTVSCRLEIIKYLRKWHPCTPVENQSDYILAVVVNE